MKKKRNIYMFAPLLCISKISQKVFFAIAFLFLGFGGYGQDLSIENVTVDEDAGTLVFEVTLDADVSGGTTVSYSFIDLTATGGVDYVNTIGPDLSFNGDEDEVQEITVAITDDFVDEGNREDFRVQLGTPTNDVGLDGGGDARGRIQDNDTAGINVSTTTGTTTETGGQATFTFTLDSQPTADVTIFLDRYDATETTGPATITLTAANWNIGVNLIVTGVDDDIIDGDKVDNIRTDDVESLDTIYDDFKGGDVANLEVTNQDDDVAGVVITPGFGTTTEAGGRATFTFTLTSEPSDDVTIELRSSDTSEGTLLSPSVTLTEADWDIGVDVIVQGEDDPIEDGPQDYIIETGEVTSDDNDYDAIVDTDVADISVTNTDDDSCALAPILNNDVQREFCGSFTYNDGTSLSLNDYTDSTPPNSTMVLTWSRVSDPLNTNAHLSPAEVANPTNDGSYFGFFYDETNNCASGTIEVELTLNGIPTITETIGDERCGPGEVVLTANGAPDVDQPPTFNWYDSPSGGFLVGTGSNISLNISTTTSYYVEVSANGCISERQAVEAIIYPLPSAGTPSNASACSVAANGPTIVDLDDLIAGESTGVWSMTTDPSNTISIGIGNIVTFENRFDGDYVFMFTTTDAILPFCANVSSEVTISVNDCDVDTDLDGLLDGLELTLGTDPNNTDTDGDGIQDGVEIGDEITNPLDEDSDGIIDALDSNILDSDMDGVVDQLDSANSNPCVPDLNSEFCVATVDLEIIKTANDDYLNVNEQITFTITVANISEENATLIQVDEVLDAVGFGYISHFTAPGDGVYDELTGLWDIPILEPNSSATLVILVKAITIGVYVNTATITASSPVDNNLENNEGSVEIEISERSNNTSGFLFNQFSPNGDGINDLLIVNKIQDYPNNSIEIYDRYGNQVFKARNYDNTWDGTRKDTDLPKGTYFYVLDLGDGSEIRKGWIQIIRQ